ncbi:DUF4270 family protein [Sphingobacterium deserti]|uniref:DUF4270 domain-containing protein n=1 Tax=Sphingobacterium deserti TaxID=1229276 RepID=A0A0B8T7F7_9SPHI|nr:DUF4270 family protein [Sphingobacterium deserti]KGE14404.1 hypothetical protein DI53_1831 [Sphingobacterium deserti]
MNHLIKRSISFFALSIFLLIITGACDKDMSVMLDNSATSNVGVSLIDSFTINTSTVQLNNLPSAGRGTILVGKAADATYGEVKSTSYFRIGFSSFTNDIPENAAFDSLTLVLRPNSARYAFGDTTKIQKINVHQLNQTLETKTITGGIQNTAIPVYVAGASIFSDQTFDYNPTAIGSTTFSPHMRSLDTLSIRLSQPVGQDFFDLIRSNDVRVSSNENFTNYFRGLVLVPDENNTAVVGFRTDTVQVKVNYSFTGNDGFRRSASKIMTLVDGGLQFNNIAYDRTGTAFEGLSATNRELRTSATGGLTYVQSGTGVVAKIEMPSLKEFLQDDNLSINKAELVIESSTPLNTMYPAPGNLMLYVADYNGIPVSALTVPYAQQAGAIQTASYVAGNQTGRNGTYTFDLIVYLKNLKSTTMYDNTSLYLSSVIPIQELMSTFSTVNTAFIATENAKPKIKLNILYTKFR